MTREAHPEHKVATDGLPYAAPLHAIESISVEIRAGELKFRATKAINSTDPYLSGHFPDLPIFPGVFTIEALRQSVAMALGESEGIFPEILTLRSVRLLAPLLPGHSITLDGTIAPVLNRKSFEVEARCLRSDGVTAALFKVEFGYGAITSA